MSSEWYCVRSSEHPSLMHDAWLGGCWAACACSSGGVLPPSVRARPPAARQPSCQHALPACPPARPVGAHPWAYHLTAIPQFVVIVGCGIVNLILASACLQQICGLFTADGRPQPCWLGRSHARLPAAVAGWPAPRRRGPAPAPADCAADRAAPPAACVPRCLLSLLQASAR